MKKALITGITGQDGHYLTDLLLQKNYKVYGLVRRNSSPNTHRINAFLNHPNLTLLSGDMSDSISVSRIVADTRPDEIYNLAAMSHVGLSFNQPEYTADVDALGTLRMLEAIRSNKLEKATRFYQASTSELFGKVQEVPQTEKTPFHPRSPYAIAKLYSYWTTVNYREAYGMFATNGILFNHESPHRGLNFVTRKITTNVAEIVNGMRSHFTIGNLESKRDWGYAKEYVEGMWRILQQDSPKDFVLATGETHSVREFIEAAFECVDIKIEWKGPKGSVEECGVNAKNNEVLVKIDPQQFRPAEVDLLIGDASLAKKDLGWEPKVKFQELVEIMVKHDIEYVKQPYWQVEKTLC